MDKNVRFTIETPDLPDLFPETDVVIRAAKEEAEKIIPITHDHYVTPEAKDGSRTWGPASWERADGKGGSKTCEYSITGVIAVGYGRGDAFKVCVEKKKCKIHWGAEIRNAAARARNPAEGGDRAHELQQQDRKAKAEESRNDAERARWVKAWPKLIVALADAIKKASATATGPLGEILLGGRPLSTPGPLPPGKTAEDLVRHLAFKEIQKLRGGWYDWERKQFLTVIAGLSLDAEKIVDQVAPREPSCRHCGCTEAKACVGGCSWAKKPDPKTGLGLCSKCPQPAKKKKKAA